MSYSELFAEAPWVSALAWSLLHFFWQGAVVGLVFALVRKAIPPRQCSARYLNGLLTLLALALLPVTTFFILLSGRLSPVDGPDSANSLWLMTNPVAGVASVSGSLDAYLPWIVAAWLVGVILVAVRSWRQWRELVRLARQWALPDARLQEVVDALVKRFGFARHIRVLVSERIDTPTLIGWIKPLILMPTAVALGFPRQQIELILAHELSHLRRYDHLLNLAQAAVETLLFYHPVVHWVAREVRNQREICCDELVLRVTHGEPREYAGALAALEELRQPPVRLVLAANGGILLERVRRIVFASRVETTHFGMRLLLPLLALVVVVLSAATRLERSDSVTADMPLPPPAAIQDGRLAIDVPDLEVARLIGHAGPVEVRDVVVQTTATVAAITARLQQKPVVAASAPALPIVSSLSAAVKSAPNMSADRVPVLDRTASPQSPEDFAPGKFLTGSPDAFAQQAAALRKDLGGAGRYGELGPAERSTVAADLEAIEALLQRKGSAARLNDREQVELMNAQERINALLTNNDADQLICTFQSRTGSRLKVKTCRTAFQRDEIRRKSQEGFHDGFPLEGALVMR